MSKKKTKVTNKEFYTFDIETTTLITGVTEKNLIQRDGIIWSGQFYNGVEYTQTRNLLNTIAFLTNLNERYKEEPFKLCIYVHNLSYEFQFIKDFFKWKKLLCSNTRKIISAETEGLVFKCSYYLSNMNLRKFLENENVPEQYQKSEMDYSKRRYPWTKLTDQEYIYCKNDVVGLHLAIQNILKHTEDNDLNNIPMTSTGYVRKDCRVASKSNYRNRFRFLDEKLTYEQFQFCRKAFRGGNTHANRRNANKVMLDSFSVDEKSAYPYELLTKKFPTEFHKMKCFTEKEFNYFLDHSDRWAMLIEVSFKNIKLKDRVSVPYIPISKIPNKPFKGEADNGRLLEADDIVKMVVTEVDYKIILNQYDFDDMKISTVYYSKKKPICKEIKNVILTYFYDKTTLDGIPEKAYFRMKQKNKLNGIYGMYVTNPCKNDYKMNNLEHLVEEDKSTTEEELLDHFYSSFNSFLSYQVGVWVTAYAREDLQELIDLIDYEDFIYCDTDSVKALHYEKYEEIIEEINDYRKWLCEQNGAFVDYNGKRVHLGFFEFEGKTKYFKTFGAKKYVYGNSNEDFKITISGVPKAKGKERILEAIKEGTLKNFYDIEIGFIFKNIKMTSAYNDYTDIKKFVIDGKNVYYASNIALYDADYTLGLSASYEKLLFLFEGVI